MKKIILGALISVATMGSAFAACPYNLDATASDYSQIPMVQAFPTLTGQSMSTQISSSTSMWMGLSHKLVQTQITRQVSASSGVNVPSSGIFAIEGKVDNSPIATSSGMVNYGFTIYGYSASSSFTLGIAIQNINGQPSRLLVTTNPTAIGGLETTHLDLPVTLPLSSNYRVAAYFNQGTGQVGIIINGINYGYLTGFTFAPISSVNIAGLALNAGVSASDPVIGSNLGLSIITDASQLISSYPTGAKDICGNTI